MAPKTIRPDLKTQIDENLRRVFEEDAHGDLPDRLVQLLEKLDKLDAPAMDKSASSDDRSES
ncbi:NepR family anti-sigma factor [Falsihalocynthiibacter arcticus]|uniref:NepR family anti-sigma factor n=1 Tax=Falsihalocynthiibacter arcticus TaxID=1579316 RepID=UPI0009EF4B0D|nr:NepR family anti-sigma factor [Falsihalocynthiibacter arcticus]